MDRVVVGVLGGGVVGAVARWAVSELGWPASANLLVVNTLGSMLLGWVMARWHDREHPMRLALGVGVCGGFTTFSGLAVELAGQLDRGEPVAAAALAAASIIGGLLAFLGGRRLAV